MPTQLPVRPETCGKISEGYCTPKEDPHTQRVSVPPKRVLPIIFLPGIMGSNLRLSSGRQTLLDRDNNIAWRPDRSWETAQLVKASPRERQLQLDPETTEVDIYDPASDPTGDQKSEPAKKRHSFKNLNVSTPLLTDDPPGVRNRRSKDEKARERGWGEVYFSSYRHILEICEQRLNWFPDWSGWEPILGTPPSQWEALPQPALNPLTKTEVAAALKGCWFPVHAMGYNWLQSNRDSALNISDRIIDLIKKYKSLGYQCEKVIIVTHSMGGIVARALIHPTIGNLASTVLGVVHGVMPAAGAPAAYRRMRCGFEETIYGLDPAPKVLGNYGTEVTAVLGNAPGGLELLPSESYGNAWLHIRRDGQVLKSLPVNGDPYEEIYKVRGKWYRLLNPEWLNPAGLPDSGFERTCKYLDDAKRFHREIAASYHLTSYAHYGADPKQLSWAEVSWDLPKHLEGKAWEKADVRWESAKGSMQLDIPIHTGSSDLPLCYPIVKLGKSVGAGDQTVPVRSAEHQLNSAQFSGIFRQTGYEHQSSYSSDKAINSTLYSLIEIIKTMKWSNHE